MSRGVKKHQQPTGDNQEGSGEEVERVGGKDERSLLEVFVQTQERRDEETRERLLKAEKREEKRLKEAEKRALEAEERAEGRRLAAQIAAEEREEQRVERAKIAEENRAEARAMAKAKRKEEEAVRQEGIRREELERLEQAEKRKEEEALRQEGIREEEALRQEGIRREELERLEQASKRKEEADKIAADKMMALQEEASQRTYNQQKALVELQAKLGEQAAEAQRLESQRAKKRERSISGILNHQRGEDVEDFLLTSERKLRAGEIPEREWLQIIASKLGGEVGTSWQELCLGEDEYQTVRKGVLQGCGYTPKAAGEAFYNFKAESLRGMAADQVYRKGAQLLRRMTAPTVIDKKLEFDIVMPWVWACVGKKARAVLDARVVTDVDGLVRGLQDYLASDGERVAGKTAVFGAESTGFRRQAYSADSGLEKKKGGALGSSSGSTLKCFKCGKIGHKAADCWQGGGKPSEAKVVEGTGNGGKIRCYTCGVEGHRSTACPGKKESQKEAGSKSVRQLWSRSERDTVLEGVVNGQGATLLLDSGAHITIVPEAMIGEELRTGSSVLVRPFQSKEPIKLPTARVKFRVEGLAEWEELVALSPVEEGKETEVLYGLDLKSARRLDLVILASKLGQAAGVNRVTTRAEGRQQAQEEKRVAEVVAREKPVVKTVSAEAVKKKAVEIAKAVTGKEGAGEGGPAADRPAGKPKPVSVSIEVMGSEKGTGEGELAVDRPVSDPEPVALDDAIGNETDEWPDLGSSEEEDEGLAEEQVDLPGEVEYCLRKDREGREDLEIPPVRRGPGDRAKLVEEVKSDPTLEGYRVLAEKSEQGFLWERGLLYKAKMTHSGEVAHLMVLPKSFRRRVLEMAHEGSGHLGARKVKALLKQRFVWPGMGVDAIAHTRSCEVCQRCAKAKGRRVPLMERQVLSEPFEVMAFDLVGPFPKAKNGYRFVLTAICMGSKWPEAIPLKSEMARAVASGMIEIFARTGIPLQLLTDQGSQFLGSLVTHLCKDLRIDQLKTAPYYPECNGVVERMHGTLVPMLTKASQAGLDRVEQLPFALFALRSAPNRDTFFSPYQLVYGHMVRTPLDILHQGWAEVCFEEMETEEWSGWLVERLEAWHELVRERGKEASGSRKAQYDKSTVNRTLDVGDQELCRVPGMTKKLKEAWHGPYVVEARKSRVDYLVKLGKGKGRTKVLHINNLKKFFPRTEAVLRLALVAEDWSEDEVVGTRMSGSCPEFDAEEVVRGLKGEFPEVFNDKPGRTDACSLAIETGSAAPRGSHPYRIPNKLKEGVREEVEKLIELGIVVPSTSPWASPVVPVPKADGTVRVCVDYRKLNEVTTADPYYMTTMEEILERVGESKVMSKLDLAKGFYQVVVEPQSQEKTAFISPFGKFEFTRMPFGLKNAPATFQRLMEVVLRECYHCSAPYIDDIVVFSGSGAEHVEHLRLVLRELRRYGLTLKESKCEFGKERMEYLGHIIGGGELAVPARRAAAMADFARPRTKRQLRSFLGAASYYRQFVCGYAMMSSVLSPLTAKSAPSVVCWTAEGLEAFARIRVSLCNVCCLTIPTQEDEFQLHTDASGSGIGATLNVIRGGVWRPVAFYSKQLQGAQHHYSATELEGLAVFKSVHFFAHYLFGCRFEVVTDHKALVSFLHSRVLNRRLHGWLLQLLQFDFTITYRPGVENSDADALSRQAWDSRDGDPWQLEFGDESDNGLRPAPSLVVGGDVGTEPTLRRGARTGGGALKEGGAPGGGALRTKALWSRGPHENM